MKVDDPEIPRFQRIAMLEKSQEFLKQHQKHVAKAESDALYYKEMKREQEEQKIKN